MAKVKLGSGLQLKAELPKPSEQKSEGFSTSVEEMIGLVLERLPKAQEVIPEVDLSPINGELKKIHEMIAKVHGEHTATQAVVAELSTRPQQLVKEVKVETIKEVSVAPAPQVTEVKQITQVKDVSAEHKAELDKLRKRLDSQNTINMALGALTFISILIHLIK